MCGRELIEVVAGKRRVRKPYIRKAAVMALSGTEFLILPRYALIEMRYSEDKGESIFIDIDEGKISSLWELIKEELPEEIVELICRDGSF
jgi:hypothetical protein